MDKETSELIEKIEVAGEGSRELDLKIAQYVGRVPTGATYDPVESVAWHNRLPYTLPFYVRSYDGALTMVPQGWIVEIRRHFNNDGEYVADVSLTDSFTVGRGCDPEEKASVSSRIVERKQGVDPTPAAICAAALKARASL
ncbi:hypothetical protein L7H23_01320 [Sphingopyxis sp. BSN-002]|uniref:hypothetical protein n=1 Tax=Sphingopyxis sp. BSN-002 TaxID=2911495 RepID=UPI001EDA1347|nr:hypothetical protein [Sphingopyxis sp. BSN-002]UKK84773.1 hypothetical protein L7H23_01320 [Sphingopyxis sp. BSN-002]